MLRWLAIILGYDLFLMDHCTSNENHVLKFISLIYTIIHFY